MQKIDSPSPEAKALSPIELFIKTRTPIELLFWAARVNPANPMNNERKAMGKHIHARIERAKAKMRKKGRATYERHQK